MRSVICGFAMVAMVAVAARAAEWSAVFATAAPAVVRIVIGDGDRGGTCSGVVINVKAGYILTAAHCIHDDASYTVAGRHAEVVRHNRVLDLAVLRTEVRKNVRQMPLAADLPKAGEAVAVIGYGFASPELAIQSGIVANPKDIERQRTLIDANMLPGDSGGAIVNAKGELVGITSAFMYFLAAHQGLAIPIDVVRDFVEGYLPEAEAAATAKK